MIDSYEFGRIVINGREYTKDLILFPDHIKQDWWRKTGHLLQPEDLEDVFERRPSRLIIGMGHDSLMKVSKEVYEKAGKLGIRVIAEDSAAACKLFNSERDAVLAIHLTC